jgi:hypothetical protein
MIKKTKSTDNNTNNYYDLSTFNSILSNISELITNLQLKNNLENVYGLIEKIHGHFYYANTINLKK